LYSLHACTPEPIVGNARRTQPNVVPRDVVADAVANLSLLTSRSGRRISSSILTHRTSAS
ncbi:MAG: hypothetical protein MUE78_09565, partial [Ilumatobacteraceae bacterium]|nr:hypothetical protein [Ilumatobacteraceae bacterium]